ncbi:MAG: hypothetical protein KA354_03885 [Phycisphaerae bacterium]|nr:hypothetical protein [Phycisphaerae bacterium]
MRSTMNGSTRVPTSADLVIRFLRPQELRTGTPLPGAGDGLRPEYEIGHPPASPDGEGLEDGDHG